MYAEAIASMITAIATLITVLTTLVIAIKTKQQTGVIRTDVNNNLTSMTDRVEQLSRLLAESGKEIPESPQKTFRPPYQGIA